MNFRNRCLERLSRMQFLKFIPIPFLLLAWAGLPASADTTARLENADLVLQFDAGASVPKMVSLQPVGHPAWTSRAPEALIDVAEVGGQRMPLEWTLDATASRAEPSHVAFVYTCDTPRLRLTWEWTARAAYGPIEHQIRIQNLGSDDVWLPLQASYRFDWQVDPETALDHVFIEKGDGSPSDVGTHRQDIAKGYQWTGTSSTYAHPGEGEPREIVPWLLVERKSAVHGSESRSGWYVGIEFSGRTALTLARDGDSLHGEAGLNPSPGPFKTRIAPGASFDTPVIFVGAFSGGLDAAGNVLRRWERDVLTNPLTWKKPDYPLTVINSWGSGMAIDEALAHRMIRDSAELGVEMFHIDAGWFKSPGDWYPNPESFPHGLAPIAGDAHRQGLKFGLWVDWTQAGLDTAPGALNARDPRVQDWLVADLPPGWKPEPFKGQTIDIGYAPARAWAETEVNRLVDDYHLDMLEHDGYLVAQGCQRTDHPHAPPDPGNMTVYQDWGASWVVSSNMTDVSYHAVRAYYDIYSRLRTSHPDLLLEVCNDGGRMVDFGSAAHADYFSITDTYDPLSNRRAFHDVSHVLPAAMLESYVEKWPTPRIENFRYMLRSGMMGWLTIMQDTTAWTPDQHHVAKEELALYKRDLRPLIRDADLYHISERPDGVHWDGLQYLDPRHGRGVVFAFRGSTDKEPRHTFILQGLQAERRYRLRFHDRTSPDRVVTGRDLMESGLTVRLAVPLSSEIVFVTELHNSQLPTPSPQRPKRPNSQRQIGSWKLEIGS